MIKILYAFVTTEADEPDAQLSFETAWENAGGTSADYDITVIENISNGMITNNFLQTYIDDGFTMIIRNTGLITQNLDVYEYALSQGMIAVIPAGTNFYHDDYTSLNGNNNIVVFCGSGVEGVGNATAYPCLFYTMSDIETPKTITSIVQSGSEITITTIGDFYDNSYGVTIQGVSGFSNNPNGIKSISSSTGIATTFKIVHNLGTGSYVANSGTASIATESYGTPKIAAQLGFIQYTTQENWQKVLSRSIQTASNTSFDTYDGFGNINVDEAINRIMTSRLIASDLTAPVLSLDSSSDITFNFSWTLIPGATSGYEVYFRDELIETLPAHLTKYRLVLTQRYLKGIKNNFQVKAINETDSASSNILEASYYNYNSIAVNQ